MKAKQILKPKIKTKFHRDDMKNETLIREKIEMLKHDFRNYHHNRIGKMYEILTEIVNLRRALPEHSGVGKNYTLRSLEWDSDLGLNERDLRIIQSYIFIGDYGKEMIKKNLINDTTLCHFIMVSTLLREEKWQKRLIDLIIARKITIGAISELTKEELTLFLQGKLKKRVNDQYILSSVKTIRSMMVRLKHRESLLRNSAYKENLLRSINKLKKYVESL